MCPQYTPSAHLVLMCPSCGQSFPRYRSQTYGKKVVACSRSCARRAQVWGESLTTYFWKTVVKTDGCWLWQRAKTGGGYGQLARKGFRCMAHRYSWELHFGPIPEGLCVCHHCDNPRCVNPAHLFVGTRADNMADCAAKHRLPRGRTPSAKITREQAESIRQRYKEGGVTQKALADEFGLAQTSIFEIIKGQRWNWKGGDALCSVVQAIVTM